MKGILIFKHAVSMVFRNWREACQLGVVPMVVLFGCLIAIAGPEVIGFVDRAEVIGPNGVSSGELLGSMLWLLAAFVLCVIWVFVGWHRFILLGIYPKGWLPHPHVGAMLGYLARAALLMVIGVLLLIPLTLLSAVLLSAPGTGNTVFFGFYAVILIIFARLSPILPAAAIGKDLKLGQALAATSGATVDLLVVIGLCAVVGVAIVLGVEFANSLAGGFGVLLVIPANLFLTLLGVSIITTLYGHYVENRPLS